MSAQALPARLAAFESARQTMLTEAARAVPLISAAEAAHIARETHTALRQIFCLGGLS